MGDRKENQKNAIQKIDDTIYSMNYRLTKLKSDRKVENDNIKIGMYDSEIRQLESQIDYFIGMKEDAEIMLAKVEVEEERKKWEDLITGAILIGIVSENLRFANQVKSSLFEGLISGFDSSLSGESDNDDSVMGTAVEVAAASLVTKEMVEGIINNKEFQYMAKYDPTKMARLEEEFKLEYEAAIEYALRRAGIKLGDSFEENEIKFRDSLKLKNGFEQVQVKASMFEVKNPNVFDNPEDKIIFDRILKESMELAKATRMIQNKFIEDRCTFRKTNGFTKEIVKKEQDLYDSILEYTEELRVRAMADVNSGKNDSSALKLYQVALEFLDPIMIQLKRDIVLQKNNEFKMKMEMWHVYEKLSKDGPKPVTQLKKEAELEIKAYTKLDRMEKQKNLRKDDGIYMQTYAYAYEATQQLIGRLRNIERFNEQEKKWVMEKLAAITLHQVLSEEIKRSDSKGGLYSVEFQKKHSDDAVRILTTKLLKSKDFNNAMKDCMKGGVTRENCVRFLAKDMERIVAKNIKSMDPPAPTKSMSL